MSEDNKTDALLDGMLKVDKSGPSDEKGPFVVNKLDKAPSDAKPSFEVRLEYDELSERQDKRLKDILRNDEYQFDYPMYNFDSKSYRRIPYLDPRFAAFKQHQEDGFALNVARVRELSGYHKIPLIASVLVTGGLLWKKPKEKITGYMLLLTSGIAFSYLYLRDMAYGSMINRVNIEAHKIINTERKTYFLSEQEKQMSKEMMEKGFVETPNDSNNKNTECNREKL